MTPGAKVFLALAGVGVVIGVIAVAAAPASAAPGTPKQPPQPKPGSSTPPDVVVPPPGASPLPPLPTVPTPPGVPAQGPFPPAQPLPAPPAMPSPPFFPPLPQQPSAPAMPPGITQSLPNPLGGPPLGTFDPATGNVFGPNGVIIGTFNPATGVFTGTGGFPQVQIPGFGTGPLGPLPPPNVVPVPVQPPLAVLPPPLAPAPVVPVAPPPAAPPAPAPVTTIEADTAAMVQALLDAETRSGWNTTDPSVAVWQRARPPLVVDSKYGPNTSLTVAKTFGTLPLIRYWPANGQSKATLLNNYQQALLALAAASPDPVHAQQLRASASREDARAFSTKGPLPAVPVSQQVQIAKVA